MCHLVLLMPIIALPVFWLIPLNFAVPIYAVIALITGLVYWLITKSMMKPLSTGAESLIGINAEVISRLGPNNYTKYLVRSQGELWSADSPDVLRTGEMVRITAVHGIRLIVRGSGNPVESTGK